LIYNHDFIILENNILYKQFYYIYLFHIQIIIFLYKSKIYLMNNDVNNRYIDDKNQEMIYIKFIIKEMRKCYIKRYFIFEKSDFFII